MFLVGVKIDRVNSNCNAGLKLGIRWFYCMKPEEIDAELICIFLDDYVL